MAWFLFIDESGQDRRDSPYEVLAGVAIQDRDLWNVVGAIHKAELNSFGRRYTAKTDEMKGKKLLKSKVFQHADLNVHVPDQSVAALAKIALDDGANAAAIHLKALALAKLRYVRTVFEICAHYRCRAFASNVDRDSPRTGMDGLRKDYAYLFERFYYFLEDWKYDERGIIVFDELEKSRSHILVDQTHKYFRDTAVGRLRSSLVIPEPLFVHSDLTTGIQIADLVAYVVSWGFRFSQMTRPARFELEPFATQDAHLRYRTARDRQGQSEFVIWSFAYIDDLRTRMERDGTIS